MILMSLLVVKFSFFLFFYVQLLGYIRIREVLRGPISIHFSDACLSRFL